MNRTDLFKKPINQVDAKELMRKTAVHEAGHAVAIYLGNKQRQLPPVFFRIVIKRLDKRLRSQCDLTDLANGQFARIEGGRLIHTLPFSFDEQIKTFSPAQKQAYQCAFEADIVNLLVGPLAEANYIALRDNELFSPNLLNLQALKNYGGYFDLEVVNDYLACFFNNEKQREKKVYQLYLDAFQFVNPRSNWFTITALANYILAEHKDVIDCDEAIDIMDASVALTRKRMLDY